MHYSHVLGARRHRAHGTRSCLGHGWNCVSSSSVAWAQRDSVCHSGDLWGERPRKKHWGALGKHWENTESTAEDWEGTGRALGRTGSVVEDWGSTGENWEALGRTGRGLGEYWEALRALGRTGGGLGKDWEALGEP